jgi:rhodanese-related sulfurtransferase
VPTVVPTIVVENTQTVPQSGLPQTDAEVPRVSIQDAAAAIQSGQAVIVDVRSTEAYQQSHIPGALSIPLFDIETNPTSLNLDKDKWIITYCT